MKKYILFVFFLFIFMMNVDAATLNAVNICGTCKGNSSSGTVSLSANCGSNDLMDTFICKTTKKGEVPDTPDDYSDEKCCPNPPDSGNNKYNIFVLLDFSGSMHSQKKVDNVNNALKNFIKALQDKNKNVKIKIWRFQEQGQWGFIEQEHLKSGVKVTNGFYDINDIKTNKNFFEIDDVPEPGGSATFIQGGLFAAYDNLKCGKNDKKCKERIPVLVLITDGLATQATKNYSVTASHNTGNNHKANHKHYIAGSDLNSYRAGVATPPHYLYYDIKTMISLRDELQKSNGQDMKIFTISTGSGDSIKYSLNPTYNPDKTGEKNRYDELNKGDGTFAGELWKILNPDKRKKYNVDGVIQKTRVLKYINSRKFSFIVDKSEFENNKNEIDLKLILKVNDRGTKVIVQGSTITRDDYRGHDNRYKLKIRKNKLKFNSNGKATVTVKTTKSFVTYDATKFSSAASIASQNPVTKRFAASLDSDGYNDSLEKALKDDVVGELDDDDYDCTEEIKKQNCPPSEPQNYDEYEHSGACITKSIPLPGTYYFKWDKTGKTGYINGGKTVVKAGDYVQIKELNIKYVVLEKSEFSFSNNNSSIYAGGGVGFGDTRFTNTVTIKYSKLSDKGLPIFNGFSLLVYKDVDGSKGKYTTKYYNKDVSEICTEINSKNECKKFLTEAEVEKAVLDAVNDRVIKEDRNADFFESIDSNDADIVEKEMVSGVVKVSSEPSSGTFSHVNKTNSIVMDYSNSLKFTSLFSLNGSCVQKNGKVRYVSSSNECGDGEIFGGNLKYVPLNYKDSTLPIYISNYSISNYSLIDITVNGSCSIGVKQNKVRYRSVDETNPFPNGAADNWGGSNTNVVKNYKTRIGEVYKKYYPLNYDYSYSGNFKYGNAPISDYNNWDKIDSSGKSQFLSAIENSSLDVRAKLNKNYCPIGKFISNKNINGYCAAEVGG